MPLDSYILSLGTLSKFPAEIRAQIFREVIRSFNKLGNSSHANVKRAINTFDPLNAKRKGQAIREVLDEVDPSHNNLAILRTSKAISQEVIRIIYPLEGHPFVIHTGIKFTHDITDALAISNGKKDPCFWRLGSKEEMRARGFRRMPLDLLFRVQVVIPAPNCSDPAQLYTLFRQVRHLVSILSDFTKPHAIDIVLTGNWFDDHQALTTRIYPEQPPDYQILLKLFFPLCEIKHAAVRFTRPNKVAFEPKTLQFINRTDAFLRRDKQKTVYTWDAEDTARLGLRIGELFAYKDLFLDPVTLSAMQGPTARMYRLQQFMRHCPGVFLENKDFEKREKCFWHVLRGQSVWEDKHWDIMDPYITLLQARYAAMSEEKRKQITEEGKRWRLENGFF